MSDSFVENIHRIKEHIQRRGRQRDKDAAHSPAGRAEHHLTGIWWFTLQFLDACHWVWYWLIRPFSRAFRWIAVRTWRGYRRLWDKVVYKEDEFGVPIFHKVRAGVLLGITAVVIYFMLIPGFFLMTDSVLYAATARVNEEVYSRGIQELDEDLHIVRACEKRACEEEDVLYFRVEDRLFNEIWSLVVKHRFFLPDRVSGTVPPAETQLCRMTSYGFRLKLFIHRMQIYPKMLSASCEPVGQIYG